MNEPVVNNAEMNQRTDSVLFVWLLLTSLFGTLIGVPFNIAALRDYPAIAWWLEPAGSLLLNHLRVVSQELGRCCLPWFLPLRTSPS